MNSGTNFLIRRGNIRDLPALEQLYAQARAFMRESGNPDQWGEDKPTLEQIQQDINLGYSFVCMGNGRLAAAFSFHTRGEPTYAHIEGEGWPDNGDYAVVPGLATASSAPGAAAPCWACSRAPCRHRPIAPHE